MKIMLLDRDRETVEMFESVCGKMADVELTIEPIKNNAIEAVRAEQYDGVFFDPAPQNEEMRAFMIGSRRGSPFYTPINVMSHQLSKEEAAKVGANDFLPKPLTEEKILKSIENLKNLSGFHRQLTDTTLDFPSKDGVISKSAFLQIFISALDRADRYGEETYLTLATVANADDIRQSKGDEIADQVCANLKKYTMRIRRLSDIAGHTAVNQLCLMLMRPANSDEPKMAIERFADSMEEYAELVSVDDAKAVVNVKMMAIPSGEITFNKDFS
jgi:hypothetical protein